MNSEELNKIVGEVRSCIGKDNIANVGELTAKLLTLKTDITKDLIERDDLKEQLLAKDKAIAELEKENYTLLKQGYMLQKPVVKHTEDFGRTEDNKEELSEEDKNKLIDDIIKGGMI